MPEVKTEGQHRGEFLLSRGPGNLSFDQDVLKSGQNVTDGRLLVRDGTGKLIASAGDLSTGGDAEEDFVGFAYGDYDATGGDTPIVVVARLAEVKASNVVLHAVTGGGAAAATAAVKEAIAAKMLIVR